MTITQPSNVKSPGGRLARVTTEAPPAGDRIIVYGPPKVGKTTLAADTPSPILLPLDDGARDRIPIPRLPAVTSLADIYATLDELTDAPHDYRTLVIDHLDGFEQLLFAEMLASDKKHRPTSIKEYGGGWGAYRHAAITLGWAPLVEKLDRLRTRRGMTILALAHSAIRTHKDPSSGGWDTYGLRIDEAAAGFLLGWSDAVLFYGWSDVRDAKERGVSGERALYTEHSATHFAGNRFGLPPQLTVPLAAPWSPLGRHIEARHQLNVLKQRLTPAMRAEVETAAHRVDHLTLSTIVEQVRTTLQEAA
jgi:hypothetical protein